MPVFTLAILLQCESELLIIVTRNASTKLYWTSEFDQSLFQISLLFVTTQLILCNETIVMPCWNAFIFHGLFNHKNAECYY